MTESNNGSSAMEKGIGQARGKSDRLSHAALSIPKLLITGKDLQTGTTSRSSSLSTLSPTFSNLSSSASETPFPSPRTEYTSDGLENLDGYEDLLSERLVTPDGTGRSSTNCQDLLLDSFRECEDQRREKGFFPSSTFTTLINEQVVGQELRRWRKFQCLGPASVDGLAQTICGDRSFKRMFALLVLVNKLLHIQEFINGDVKDEDLPLRRIFKPGSQRFGLGREADSQDPLKCFELWDSSSIRSFEEWQWTMLAPIFEKGKRRDVQHLVLGHKQPLPFLKDSRFDSQDGILQGGHSTVFKVEIHPDHHNFTSPLETSESCNSFAVKRLDSREQRRFRQEVDMLVTFSGESHQHLISLLATYQQGNEYYLIFPWAGGDLRSYWEDINPKPKVNRGTISWMAEQCFGLARGLSKIHQHETAYFRGSSRHPFVPEELISSRSRSGSLNLFGRHGDIKPQNVLWFKSLDNESGMPTLKITDLGLADFKTSIAKIYQSPRDISLTAIYRPPECDTNNGVIGQSHDIWALGCLYLEMITWLLGGWKLLQEFEQLRVADTTGSHSTEGAFFKVTRINADGRREVMVKPTVTEFIARLQGHPICTDYFHQFLDLIKQEMLITKPTDPKEKGRIQADALVYRLGAMRKSCTLSQN